MKNYLKVSRLVFKTSSLSTLTVNSLGLSH